MHHAFQDAHMLTGNMQVLRASQWTDVSHSTHIIRQISHPTELRKSPTGSSISMIRLAPPGDQSSNLMRESIACILRQGTIVDIQDANLLLPSEHARTDYKIAS